VLHGYRDYFQGIMRPGRGADHSPLHLVPRLRISGDVPLLPPYAFMVWTGTTSRSF